MGPLQLLINAKNYTKNTSHSKIRFTMNNQIVVWGFYVFYCLFFQFQVKSQILGVIWPHSNLIFCRVKKKKNKDSICHVEKKKILFPNGKHRFLVISSNTRNVHLGPFFLIPLLTTELFSLTYTRMLILLNIQKHRIEKTYKHSLPLLSFRKQS